MSLSTPVFSCLSTKQSTGPVSGSVLCAFRCRYESETTYLQAAGSAESARRALQSQSVTALLRAAWPDGNKIRAGKAETDETGKHISTRVLETYSMADVVKTLAKIYSG